MAYFEEKEEILLQSKFIIFFFFIFVYNFIIFLYTCYSSFVLFLPSTMNFITLEELLGTHKYDEEEEKGKNKRN